jgi:hypothetical protein
MDGIPLIFGRIDFANAQYEETKKSKYLNIAVSLDTNKVPVVMKMGKRSYLHAAEAPAQSGPQGIRVDFNDGARVPPFAGAPQTPSPDPVVHSKKRATS